MQKSLTIIRYLIAIVIVLALAGLLGWYFFLKTQTTTTIADDAARGLSSAAPSFTGSTGSTYENVAQTVVDGGGVSTVDNTSTPPELWRVSSNPTAGMGFVREGASAQIRFVERATGNVFSADLMTGRITRLTNTLLPKTYFATFSNDGSVINRSLDGTGKVITFAGIVPTKKPPEATGEASTSEMSLKGTYLAENIQNLVTNPTTREVLYILSDPKVGTIGIRSAWDGTGQKRVFESGILGWRPIWLSDGRIILAQNPAYNIGGYAYVLGSDGSLTPLVRNIPGLTILPRASSKTFIFGVAADNTIALYTQTGEGAPQLLPIKTVADKCVWAPDQEMIVYCAVPQKIGTGNFLDNWLQGRIHTSDTWWQINTKDGTAQILFTSETTSTNSMDATQVSIDDTGRYVAFINSVDNSLWVLRIPIRTPASTDRL